MAELGTSKLRKLGTQPARPAASRDPESKTLLRCQWCTVDLEPGVEVCPACGSAGVDPTMTVPELEELAPVEEPTVTPQPEEELDEWWNDAEAETYENSAETEGERTPIIIGLLVTVVACTLLGMFLTPPLIASAFESNLGVTVESTSDLRPLGGILGFLLGSFIGAIGLIVTTPRN